MSMAPGGSGPASTNVLKQRETVVWGDFSIFATDGTKGGPSSVDGNMNSQVRCSRASTRAASTTAFLTGADRPGFTWSVEDAT